MKSDFSIGDRVQISALGALRCPGIAERTGTIVGRSAYVNCARVLLDGNKSPTTINLNYLKEISIGKCRSERLVTVSPVALVQAL